MNQIPMIRLGAMLAALVRVGIRDISIIRKNLIWNKGKREKKPSWFACIIKQCVTEANIVEKNVKVCSFEHRLEAEKAGNTPVIASLQAKGSFHSEGSQCAKHKSSEISAVENAIRVLPKAEAQIFLNRRGQPTENNSTHLGLPAHKIGSRTLACSLMASPGPFHIEPPHLGGSNLL